MQNSKIGGIPFVAVLFVICTAAAVSLLVCAYLTLFIYNGQIKQLNRIESGVNVLLIPTTVPTPVITATPSAEVAPPVAVKPTVKAVVVPATTSAK